MGGVQAETGKEKQRQGGDEQTKEKSEICRASNDAIMTSAGAPNSNNIFVSSYQLRRKNTSINFLIYFSKFHIAIIYFYILLSLSRHITEGYYSVLYIKEMFL